MNVPAMKLSVPFIPDEGYARFLTRHISSISSIYFPLVTGPITDARVRISEDLSTETHDLCATLLPLKAIDKYILMNTRFMPPDLYGANTILSGILDDIARLNNTVGIKGIVLSDMYLLQALDRTGHDIIPRLEPIPGINAMLDSPGKLFAFFDMLALSRFKKPTRIVPDRALNRNLEKLALFSKAVKNHDPTIRIELLANEGCIYQCPFKLSHDAHISLSNTGLVRETTFQLNQNLGCQAYLTSAPHAFLKSPFIRPEDIHHYQGIADGIKLCGRTRGVRFLKKCIRAYVKEYFDGNLLDLMDTPEILARQWHIDNACLGNQFFTTLTSCTKICKPCKICSKIFSQASWKKEITFKSYKEFQ
jgi:collagenase-like PrtC family protease